MSHHAIPAFRCEHELRWKTSKRGERHVSQVVTVVRQIGLHYRKACSSTPYCGLWRGVMTFSRYLRTLQQERRERRRLAAVERNKERRKRAKRREFDRLLNEQEPFAGPRRDQ